MELEKHTYYIHYIKYITFINSLNNFELSSMCQDGVDPKKSMMNKRKFGPGLHGAY